MLKHAVVATVVIVAGIIAGLYVGPKVAAALPAKSA